MRVVIDTNVLLQAISSRSVHYWIWEALRTEALTLCITTDILLEYEEILERKRNSELAQLILEIILLMPNVVRVEKYFFHRMPFLDPDDEKFTDCAIACGAAYLVTEDRHYKEVNASKFPIVNVINPFEFRLIYENQKGLKDIH
jgi:uncharacterized protein